MSGHDRRQRYLGLLDEALCQGNWTDVTELSRKVDKHIPERKHFSHVARIEAQIATATRRPGTSSTSASTLPDASDAVTNLTSIISDSNCAPDDEYCAKVCLAGLHWFQHGYAEALKALPSEDSRSGDEKYITLGWLEVCAAKAAFIRATALERSSRDAEADKVYTSAASRAPGTRSAELRRWTERLLAAGCMFKYQTEVKETTSVLSDRLQTFRAWNEYWQRAPAQAAANTNPLGQHSDNPRRTVWQSYYILLSTILRTGLVYSPATRAGDLLIEASPAASDEPWYHAARLRQVEELKSVEATYESLIVSETQFPKANENNVEVEEWVECAVSNWRILHGTGWASQELGAKGRDGITRDLLDILYRAASKTFHSTAILRHLFTTHAALGEYDLAMHAFSSYEEIAEKGKARAQKTGKRELGFDDDDTIILTAVEAVRVLCRYGEYKHAEKAVKVGKTIEKWLAPETKGLTSELDGKSQVDELHSTESHDERRLQISTVAAAFRAIGISQAHWARSTFDADARGTLQTKAIANLKRADKLDSGNIDTTFALAKVLAETRDLASAIELLKSCISNASAQDDKVDTEESDDLARSRQLMPLWHLLSYCLAATEEFEPAIKVCNAAFDHFRTSSSILSSSSLSASTSGSSPQDINSIEQMDCLEKETVLQIKLSQLAFLELTESADAAVDKADELLALYTQLFGRSLKPAPPVIVPTTSTSAAPSRGVGTLRGKAGSIRIKPNRHSAEQSEKVVGISAGDDDQLSPHTSRVISAGSGLAPAKINESQAPSARHSRHHLHLPFRGRAQSAATKTSKSVEDPANEKERTISAANRISQPPQINASAISGAINHDLMSDNSSAPQQDLRSVEHNLSEKQLPEPLSHNGQPPEQDVRLPTSRPGEHSNAQDGPLVKPHERQHNITALTKIWLFVANLYIKAGHFDDASGAIDEAARIVATYEVEMIDTLVNGRGLALKGWSGGDSVDGIQANVSAARGDLARAQNLPHKAMGHYEQALSYDVDNAAGILGISDLLMDIYEEKLAAEEPVPLIDASSSLADGLMTATPQTSAYLPRTHVDKSSFVAQITGRQLLGGSKDPTPAELNRLAARDRAYMLLSTLTKLGHGWDNPEAWLRLARSYELSKQIDKARQALWWVVELEDHRPIRPWNTVAGGGYTL